MCLCFVDAEETSSSCCGGISDDTASAMSLVAEGTADPAASDPVISSVISGSDAIVTKIKYSIQLEEDAFQWQQWLTSTASQRVGRNLNAILTTGKDLGTGTQCPSNIAGGLLQSAVVAGIAAASGQIAYSDLMSLKSAVDESYRQSGVYLASQQAHDLLEAALDGANRPLYEHDDQGYLLVAGQRLYINSAMVFASGKPAVMYGSFDQSAAMLDGGSQIRILTEAPGLIENLMHEALIVSRIGSAPLISTSVKTLLAK